jgi:tetratricopeptide (TPR) repeat protein
MGGDQIVSFFLLYPRPVTAISRILDRGRLWFALAAAIVVALMLHAPDMTMRQPPREAAVEAAQVQQPAPPNPADIAQAAALRFISWEPGGYFAPLFAVVIILVPAVIAIRAFSGFGSFGVLMRRDYMSMVICAAFAWAAAYLPLAVARLTLGASAPAILRDPPLFAAANVYFLALVVLALRTILGVTFAPALGLTLAAAAAAIAGSLLFSVAGGGLAYLASPFFLFYAYRMFGADFQSLGDGLRSRQHLRRQLEIATNNPRDADAHYQLGLIYQQRRQYSEAIARYSRAREIDPREAGPHYQLGLIALKQQRFDDAIEDFRTAASLDDKLSSSEVWRDLGAAYYSKSQYADACTALDKYASRRPYDPEGLYWLGMTLAALGRNAEARERLKECIEAVNTMPAHRRAHVRSWGSQAKAALRKVDAASAGPVRTP